MAATVEELKSLIVGIKMEVIKLSMQKGNCPYAYYSMEQITSCDDTNCNECKKDFMSRFRKDIEENVKNL